jgi:hypothetical protein
MYWLQLNLFYYKLSLESGSKFSVGKSGALILCNCYLPFINNSNNPAEYTYLKSNTYSPEQIYLLPMDLPEAEAVLVYEDLERGQTALYSGACFMY